MNQLTLPMPLLWLLVLGLVLWRWKGLSRAVFLVGTLPFLALSLPASGKLLVSILQAGAPALGGKVPEGTTAIFVPSGGTIDDGTGSLVAAMLTVAHQSGANSTMSTLYQDRRLSRLVRVHRICSYDRRMPSCGLSVS